MKLKCPKCKNKYFRNLNVTKHEEPYNHIITIECRVCDLVFDVDVISFNITIEHDTQEMISRTTITEKYIQITGVEL